MLQIMFLFKMGMISICLHQPFIFRVQNLHTCHVEIFAVTACNAKASNSSFKDDVWGETTLAVDFMTSQCPKTWRYARTEASVYACSQKGRITSQRNTFLYITYIYINTLYIFCFLTKIVSLSLKLSDNNTRNKQGKKTGEFLTLCLDTYWILFA